MPDLSSVDSPFWFNNELAEIVAPFQPRIVSLQTLRSAIDRLSAEEEVRNSEPEFSIDVYYRVPQLEGTLLTGDLFAVKDGHFAGISISCSIDLKKPNEVTEKVAEALGYWATHVLYDTAVHAWNQLVSNSFQFREIVLPIAPKKVNLATKELLAYPENSDSQEHR